MFTEIFRFELSFRVQRFDTYLYFLVLFLFSLIAVDFLFEGQVLVVARNSPVIIARTMGITSALFLMIVSMIAGTSILRDFSNNTHSLFFSFPFTKWEYLMGRFLGSFVTVVVIFLALPLGIMLSPFLPWQDPTDFVSFNFLAYLQPFICLIIPTLFFSSALFFVTGLLTRKLLLIYLQAFFFLLIYLLALNFAAGSDDLLLTTLIEPFTFQSIRIITGTWSNLDRNTLLVPIEGVLLANRILWVGFGIITLFIGHYFFKFETNKGSRKKNNINASKSSIGTHSSINSIRKVITTFTTITMFNRLVKQTWFNFRLVVNGISFWAILLVTVGILLINGFSLGTNFGVDNLPTTYLIVGELVELTIIFFVGIILFYSGELIWKERDEKVNYLADSLPIENWSIVLSKLLGLVFLLVLLMFLMILTGIGFQAFNNYFEFEIGLYLTAFFLEIFPFLLLMALVSFIVQLLVNHKYVSHLITVLILAITTIGFLIMGLDHVLVKFGGSFLPTYSDVNGYSDFMESFFWVKTYWISFTFFILTLVIAFTPRGAETSFKLRLRGFGVHFSPDLRNAALILFLMTIGSGSFVFYNTNVLNQYHSSDEELNLRASYELQLKHYNEYSQPEMDAVSLELDLFPDFRSYQLNGSYRLVNRTNLSIDTLLIQKLPNDQVKLWFPNQPIVESIDSTMAHFGFYKLVLSQSLYPDESISLLFKQSFNPVGFTSELNPSLVSNGTLIDNFQFPSIGYLEDIEVSDPTFRDELQLPKKNRSADLGKSAFGQIGKADGDGEYINFEIILSTDSTQIAVAPGELLNSWFYDERAYFHYSTERKISNLYSIASAKYETLTSAIELANKSGSVDLEIYYHPGHEFNIGSMMNAMELSVDYFSEIYSTYQFNHLRIAEVPLYHDRAQSLPGFITVAENIGFTLDIITDETPDLPFFITAHEVAHQWWGDQINPSNVQGQTMISETMAQYSALSIFQHTYPKEQLNEILQWNMRQYIKQRAQEPVEEVPLYLVETGQSYIYYRKGLIVMNAFQKLVSEKKINQALAEFIQDWNSFSGQKYLEENRFPISTDVLKYFYAVTPDSLIDQVKELFEDIVIYDNKIEKIDAVEITADQFEVNLTLSLDKLRVVDIENEQSMDFTRPIEIGFYQIDESGNRNLIEKIEITKKFSQSDYIYTFTQRPDILVLDPDFTFLDKNILDNKRYINWE